jgi:moderate conductance mechanosensitive channel
VPFQPVDPQVQACGPPADQGFLCSTVYELTDSQDWAEFADRFTAPLRILLILLGAYIVVRLGHRVIRRVVRRLETGESEGRIETFRRRTGLALLDSSDEVPSARRIQRAQTIGIVLRSVVSFAIWTIALLMCLGELGINIAPIVAGAGVIGVALGFGAQTIVRDFLSGLFMLIEEQYGVGDVIDAGDAIGTVEAVSLRTTRLRDFDGVVWHVPNGEIKRLGNQSQQWSRAVVDVPVAYETDIPTATGVIKQVADELWHDPDYQSVVLGEPEVWGIEELTGERLVIRVAAKTQPREQAKVARELRARIKKAFDEAGIEVPKP